MQTCKDCIHINVCGFRHTMDVGDGYAEDCGEFSGKGNLRKEMNLREAIIFLDKLNTTERVVVDRDKLTEAVKVVSAAAKYRIPHVIESLEGTATDGSGNPVLIRQPCCPNCQEPLLNPSIRKINYCYNCGQSIIRALYES